MHRKHSVCCVHRPVRRAAVDGRDPKSEVPMRLGSRDGPRARRLSVRSTGDFNQSLERQANGSAGDLTL